MSKPSDFIPVLRMTPQESVRRSAELEALATRVRPAAPRSWGASSIVMSFGGTPLAAEGSKFDGGKPPMGLLPMLALTEVAKVLGFGAKKYAPSNWRKGMAWSRNIDASMRHLTKFAYGIDTDKESGCLHLAQSIIDLLFVLEYYLTGTGTDDRHKYDDKTLAKIKDLLGE